MKAYHRTPKLSVLIVFTDTHVRKQHILEQIHFYNNDQIEISPTVTLLFIYDNCLS